MALLSSLWSWARLPEAPLDSSQQLGFLIELESSYPGFFASGDLQHALEALTNQQKVHAEIDSLVKDRDPPLRLLFFHERPPEPDPKITKDNHFLSIDRKYLSLSENQAEKNLKSLDAHLGGRSSQGAWTGISKALPPEHQREFFLSSAEGRYAIARSLLPEVPSQRGFRPDVLGLTADATREEILAELEIIQKLETEIKELGTYLTYRMDPTHRNQYFEHVGISKPSQKLVGSHLRDLGIKNVPLFESPAPVLELKEMPLNSSLLRGCVGGDCSTKKSFAYTNLPTERSFLVIKDGRSAGYAQWTEVLKNDEKALYLHTVAGARLSPRDIEVILDGLSGNLEAAGYKHVLLPTSEKIPLLINYASLRKVISDRIKGQPVVKITYTDNAIRQRLHKHVSAIRGFDKAEFTPNAVLAAKNNLARSPVRLAIETMKQSGLSSFTKPSKGQVLEFLISHLSLQDRETLLAKEGGFAEFADDIAIMRNPAKLPFQEHAKRVEAIFAKYQIPLRFESALTKMKGAMLEGVIRCSDALTTETRNTIIAASKNVSTHEMRLQIAFKDIKPWATYAIRHFDRAMLSSIPNEAIQQVYFDSAPNTFSRTAVLQVKDRLFKNTDTTYQRYLARTYAATLRETYWTEAELIEDFQRFVNNHELHLDDLRVIIEAKEFWKHHPRLNILTLKWLDESLSRRPSLLKVLRELSKANHKPLLDYVARTRATRHYFETISYLKTKRTPLTAPSCIQRMFFFLNSSERK